MPQRNGRRTFLDISPCRYGYRGLLRIDNEFSLRNYAAPTISLKKFHVNGVSAAVGSLYFCPIQTTEGYPFIFLLNPPSMKAVV